MPLMRSTCSSNSGNLKDHEKESFKTWIKLGLHVIENEMSMLPTKRRAPIAVECLPGMSSLKREPQNKRIESELVPRIIFDYLKFKK